MIELRSEPEVRAIPGWEGIYSARQDGEIISHSRWVPASKGRHLLRTRLLRPYLAMNYMHVDLSREGSVTKGTVHVLVCSAFHGSKQSPELQVNHRDGNRLNNRADNLEWVTPSQNQFHSADNKLMRCGEDSHLAKLTERDVIKIRELRAAGALLSELADQFNVCANQISKIHHRKCWRNL